MLVCVGRWGLWDEAFPLYKDILEKDWGRWERTWTALKAGNEYAV